MKREKKANRYGRLMIKHWKAGNEKMAKFYHNKLHNIFDKKIPQQKKAKKERNYIIVNFLDHTGRVIESRKQFLQSAYPMGEASSRGKAGSL